VPCGVWMRPTRAADRELRCTTSKRKCSRGAYAGNVDAHGGGVNGSGSGDEPEDSARRASARLTRNVHDTSHARSTISEAETRAKRAGFARRRAAAASIDVAVSRARPSSARLSRPQRRRAVDCSKGGA
jgi:hypothetical protein